MDQLAHVVLMQWGPWLLRAGSSGQGARDADGLWLRTGEVGKAFMLKMDVGIKAQSGESMCIWLELFRSWSENKMQIPQGWLVTNPLSYGKNSAEFLFGIFFYLIRLPLCVLDKHGCFTLEQAYMAEHDRMRSYWQWCLVIFTWCWVVLPCTSHLDNLLSHLA